MGGFVKDLFEAGVKAFESTSESSIGQWLKPSMSELSKTAAGKVAGDVLKNEFEPEVSRATAFYRTQLGYNAKAAVKAAVQDTGEQFFGKRGEGIINLLHAIDAQGGSKIHMNNVADIFDLYLGEKGFNPPNWRLQAMKEGIPLESLSSKYQPAGPVERKLKEVASWIFLPRIVIPHATQPLNVLLYNGASAFGKATAEMLVNGIDVAKRRVVMSGALEDNILHNYIDTAKGGGLARKLFHMPGFNFMREMQITHAALAGEFSVRDAFADYIANGRRLTPKMSLVFERHGIDTAALAGLNDLTPEMIKTAQYRAAQATYFMRSSLDIPYPWGQNWFSRTATLYKHFGYNQGRFIVSTIKSSFEASPEEGMKTLAMFSTLYPMAGIAVKGVTDAINLRPAPTTAKERGEYYEQYLDAIGHAAGFGIAYSMFRSAKRNALADWAIGPIPSTITDFTQDIINAPSSESRRRQLGRDVIRRIPLVGPGLQQELIPKKRRGAKYISPDQ